VRFGKSKTEAAEEPGRGGGGDFIRYLKDGSTTFRILQEQDEWVYFWEHFSPAGFSFPCPRSADDPVEMCPGCSSDNDKMRKAGRKIAFNVLHSVNGNEYIDAFKVGPMVADKLENRIKRYDTITDRDYTITKYKTGNDRWDFDVEGATPTPIDLRKEEWKDIEAMLQQAWDDAWGDPEAAERNKAAAEMQTARPRATIAPAPKRVAPKEVAPEEPPFEEKSYREEDLRAMELPKLVETIRADMKVTPPETLKTSDEVVDWLMALQG